MKIALLIDTSAHLLQRLGAGLQEACPGLLMSAVTANVTVASIPDREVYNVIVADIEGTGHSGITLVSSMKKKQPGAAVIVYTSAFMEEIETACRKAGADYFFRKPHDFDTLLETVKTYCETGDPAGRETETAGKNLIMTKEREKLSFNIFDKTILIVDDDPDNRNYIRLALRDSGIKLFFAANGEEAVDTCRWHPELDMVLMDKKMPVMDGVSATMLLREFNRRVVVVAMTSIGMNGDKDKMLSSGCDDHLLKTVNKSELYRIMKKWL